MCDRSTHRLSWNLKLESSGSDIDITEQFQQKVTVKLPLNDEWELTGCLKMPRTLCERKSKCKKIIVEEPDSPCKWQAVHYGQN